MLKISPSKGDIFKCFEFIEEITPRITFKGAKVRYSLCKCVLCNEVSEVSLYYLTSKRIVQSCGCQKGYLISLRRSTHGLRNTRIYKIWSDMKYRCYGNKNNHVLYNNISICDEWLKDFKPFYNWAMSNGYNDNLSIDRINNDGNYEPNNCRWATRVVQARNTRRIRATNTSGLRGVSFEEKSKKWVAQVETRKDNIRTNKKIGRFKCKYEAGYYRDKYVKDNNLEITLNYELIKI